MAAHAVVEEPLPAALDDVFAHHPVPVMLEERACGFRGEDRHRARRQRCFQLRKQGGFIPGVRPGAATAAYIKSAIDHVTLPGALFMAVLAVVPTIIFWFTGNSLIQAFGGTSVLIMVGVAMDTLSSIESQLKMHNYDGFFK